MRNLKITLAYDGTDYCGWQVQRGRASIQGELTAAIERACGERVSLHGSGRTDAGVHALAQVASVVIAAPIPVEKLRFAINNTLPRAIRVLQVEEAQEGFHARESAVAKTYRYRIARGAVTSPFVARYVLHYPYPLNEEAMREAADAVVGEHDFTSFAAADPEKRRGLRQRIADEGVRETASEPPQRARRTLGTPGEGAGATSKVRTILSSSWRREGGELIYEVRGAGFLHHMVRNLVGSFLLVGKGTISRERLRFILAAKDRSLAGPTAPAEGLVLVGVEY